MYFFLFCTLLYHFVSIENKVNHFFIVWRKAKCPSCRCSSSAVWGYALIIRTAVMNFISSPVPSQASPQTFFLWISCFRRDDLWVSRVACIYVLSPQPYLSWHIKRTHPCLLCGMRKTQCSCVQFWEHQLWERAANWRESRWSQGAGTRDTSGQAEATGLVWAALET